MRVGFFLSVILLLVLLSVDDSMQKKTVYPYDMKIEFNKNFVNLTVDLSNWKSRSRKNPPTNSPEISAWLLRNLTNAMFILKVKHKQSGNVLLDQTVNVCHFSKLRNNLLSKNLFDEIERNIDFKLQCPFKKGKYQVKSSPFSEVFFPSFIQEKDPFETTIVVKSKIVGRLESLATITHKWEVVEISDNS